MKIVKLAGFIVLFFMLSACTSQKNQTNSENQKSEGFEGEPPNFYTVLEQMDANGDGKIALSEAKGPMDKDFASIDANHDGYITNAEFQNAPKPQKEKPDGQRPPPGQGGGPPR